jgi:hypothetical protein
MMMNHAFNERLDIFQTPAFQTSVERVNFVEIEPVNSIAGNGAIEFNCPADVNEFIDLQNSFLYIRCRITRADGTELQQDVAAAAAEAAQIRDSNIHPTNLVIASLFSDVIVSLNGTVVSSCDKLYPYMAYFNVLAQSADEQQELHNAGLYSPGDVRQVLSRKHRNSSTVEYAGKMFSDIFRCPILPD